MEFRTKREAEEAAQRLEQRGDRCADAAGQMEQEGLRGDMEKMMDRASRYRTEAARIRALLPTLGE